MIKKTAKYIAVTVIAVCAVYVLPASAQSAFENAIQKKFDSLAIWQDVRPPKIALSPNDAQTGIMVPPGWGGSGTAIFGGIGGTYPEEYRNNKADLIASAGFCIGDPVKYINFAASLNITDVHRFSDLSGNFIVSRQISTGNSISAGALQVFANPGQSDASKPTFYVAYSHAVQWLPSQTPGCSALSYTIGIGNGRFLDKSPEDVAAGKGKYGTAVFGSVSYEIIRHTNLSAEWDGQNLGFSVTTRPFASPFSIGAGVDNLTRYTGNRTSMIFSVGYPLSLTK